MTTHTLGSPRPMNGLDYSLHDRLMVGTSAQTILQWVTDLDNSLVYLLIIQVSPYNLFRVRALRYFEVLFLMITFVWWVLLLVSIFVSPPGLNSRGSGFFDFSYTTLTIGNILIALLFFAVPSTPMGVLSMTLSVLLIVDMIVIVAVARIRVEEGWVGIASVVWAAIIGLYNVVANKTVRWGKKDEEERLTGREETRRSLWEWCAVVSVTVIMSIMVIIVILLTATLILRARDATLPPPGERIYVEGGKYRIHVACFGNRTYDSKGNRLPTILLEGGTNPVEDSFEDWVYDAMQNGTIDRYCYYDRPGLAWSDNAPSPHSAGMSVDALSEALAITDETGPWIVAGAGIGGIYSRIFSARHLRDVHGIMLIDALQEDLLYQVGSPGRGFILWARGIISPLGLDRLAGALFKGRTREDRVYGQSAYQGGKFIKAKLQENLVADSLTKSEVAQSRNIQSRKTPLVVVSSGIHVKKDREWERKQEDLTKITNNLIAWDVVGGAPPEEVWRTYEGRRVLEKRLKQLYRGV
jgi:pimeloyl-ACP methyl ester carboxylesterase